MYEIEKRVNYEGSWKKGRPSIYPFGDMEVGDSFSAPISERKKIKSSASLFGKRNSKKFSIRTQKDGLIRIWRIE